MERIGELISLDRIEISRIFHCSGLLLCITKDKSRLVVWNPCSGQTRWIEPPRNSHYDILDRYALGYEKYSQQRPSLKVLRFVDDVDTRVNRRVTKFEIYNLSSNSWKVVDGVNDPDWEIESHHYGVSLKGGNTYWCARQKHDPPRPDFLICFDFTTERFGPRLPLPFRTFWEETVTLSSVRETQLAVLCQKSSSQVFTVKIWITSEIGPNTVCRGGSCS
ncbi:F-box/kelch-repeat protein [Raphanus sativus]|nr:F-box/kelch-repeat protein [Raphanus sativus]